ncbi:hypothetical protein CB740_17305 [Salmonella enterica subsp. enterica serovar Enteritidis]|nr:hypothetical protein [Salmonella enterica subsp. enterica serovar Enteritidis]
MSTKTKYDCYNGQGRKLGYVLLDGEGKGLRDIFIENKAVIKAYYPGTVFIKPARKDKSQVKDRRTKK